MLLNLLITNMTNFSRFFSLNFTVFENNEAKIGRSVI